MRTRKSNKKLMEICTRKAKFLNFQKITMYLFNLFILFIFIAYKERIDKQKFGTQDIIIKSE